MKNQYIGMLLMLLATTVYGQQRERVVSGQLRSSEDGSPLPGVNVVVVGIDRGTVTDAEGRYSISAPIGSTLRFTFIGMNTREVVVTESGLESHNGAMRMRTKPTASWHPSILSDSVVQSVEGVATLTDDTPSYRFYGVRLVPTDIVAIRRAWWPRIRRQTPYVLSTNGGIYRPEGFSLQVNNAIGINTPARLPALQNQYAQGRAVNGSLEWRGPESLEPMSWGPSVKTLEYSGTASVYDRNGTLTVAGSGNSNPAKTFDAYRFLQRGATTTNELVAWFPGLGNGTTNVDVLRHTSQGTIPNSESQQYKAMMNMKSIRFSSRLSGDVNVLFNSSNATLLTRGANVSNIIGSMMSTSATFDLANGYGRKQAVGNASAFQLIDGSPRSAAPGLIDNPYGLVNLLPDRERSYRLWSVAGLQYDTRKLKINFSTTYEKHESNIIHGVSPGLSPFVAGRVTKRSEQNDQQSVRLTGVYSTLDKVTTFTVGYHFRRDDRRVNRTDGFGYTPESYHHGVADSINTFAFGLLRNTHEIMTKVQYAFAGLDISLTNYNYFSNTAKVKDANLFPSLTIKYNIADQVYMSPFWRLSPFVSIGRTITEASALFGNNAVLSTQLQIQQYNRYFENREITWHDNLAPETAVKFETGLNASTHINMEFDLSYYYNTTFDFILPVWIDGASLLQNVATVNNRGIDASISYFNHNHYALLNWRVALRWTKYNNTVRALHVPQTFVPLAGFRDIQTVAAAGEALGVIYGSSFQKNDEGQFVIGDDGFPLVDSQLKKIGNPIPRYILALEPGFDFKRRMKLSFLLEYKNGGDVWNGTRAALGYLGRSQESADLRTISGFIYDGVNAEGNSNTVPVDMYNPTAVFDRNKWVRYGYGGVGEEYIEDASWLRLSEVSLSHKFFFDINDGRKELEVSFLARNLFLITPYTGVDPAVTLFGYSAGTGLDLFNSPGVKSYSLILTIKL